MEQNKKGFMNIQLFADEAVDGVGADATVDYQALYNTAMGEIEKLKKQVSKVNSENAEYKREKQAQKQAQMTEEDKRKIEQQELLDKLAEVEKQLDTYKLKDTLNAQGYTAKEIDLLIKGGCTAEVYAKIMNDRLTAQAESLKATNLVNSTATPPAGATDGEKLTNAQRILGNGYDNAQEIKNKFNK